MRRMRQADPLEALKSFVETHPTQKAAATALGINESYLSDLLKARRKFSERMLEALGLKQVVVKS